MSKIIVAHLNRTKTTYESYRIVVPDEVAKDGVLNYLNQQLEVSDYENIPDHWQVHTSSSHGGTVTYDAFSYDIEEVKKANASIADEDEMLICNLCGQKHRNESTTSICWGCYVRGRNNVYCAGDCFDKHFNEFTCQGTNEADE